MFKRYGKDFFLISVNNLLDLESVSRCLYNVLHLPYFIGIEVFGKLDEVTIYYIFVKSSDEDYDAQIQKEINKALHKEEL